MQDLSSGAVGWLGSTAGVTQDGRFIALARFESEAAARANSDRPEQDEWWAESSKLFDGEVTFHDGTRTEVDLVGDPDQAGFVQVVQGRVRDPDRARERMRSDQQARKVHRPDVLGSVTVEYDDGGFTRAIYFTTEDEARRGELEVPPELRRRWEESHQLIVGEPEFLDLQYPWLYTAR